MLTGRLPLAGRSSHTPRHTTGCARPRKLTLVRSANHTTGCKSRTKGSRLPRSSRGARVEQRAFACLVRPASSRRSRWSRRSRHTCVPRRNWTVVRSTSRRRNWTVARSATRMPGCARRPKGALAHLDRPASVPLGREEGCSRRTGLQSLTMTGRTSRSPSSSLAALRRLPQGFPQGNRTRHATGVTVPGGRRLLSRESRYSSHTGHLLQIAGRSSRFSSISHGSTPFRARHGSPRRSHEASVLTSYRQSALPLCHRPDAVCIRPWPSYRAAAAGTDRCAKNERARRLRAELRTRLRVGSRERRLCRSTKHLATKSEDRASAPPSEGR